MIAALRPALVMLALFTLLCGLVYPLVVTGVAQAVLPARANGSLLERPAPSTSDGGKAGGVVVVGSALIGQSFRAPEHFWSRPSATSPAYNGAASTGSNLGPLNPALVDAVQARVAALAAADAKAGVTRAPSSAGAAPRVPIDLVTASASGLDPHITPAAAYWQVPRVAHVRHVDEARVEALVAEHVEGRTLGLFGEPRVNVLLLNLDLDDKFPMAAPAHVDGEGVDGTP